VWECGQREGEAMKLCAAKEGNNWRTGDRKEVKTEQVHEHDRQKNTIAKETTPL